MATRLTSFSKFLITLLIVGGIGFALWYFANNTEMGNKIKQQANEKIDNGKSQSGNSTTGNTSSGDDDVLKVQIFTWGGYVPGLYFNEGDKWSKNSRFFTEYGIKVDFELIDDFDGSRNAWIADEVHLLGNEVSAMNTEMERLAPHDPKIVLQCDWSRGGDAVVVKRGIKSVNDLRGKKIAYAGFTPSVTFLVSMLESAGMTLNDIEAVEVPLPTDAANAFKGGKVDAAVVWSPDDLICVREVPGSKVLQSTRDASHIIADIFMVKGAYARTHKEQLAKFYEGWMKGAAEINAVGSNKAKAVKILSEVTGLPKADAEGMIDNVRLTNHGDNENFFGLNVNYKGMTAERLYSKMGNIFAQIGQAPKNRPSWRQLSWPYGAQNASLNGKSHLAEGSKNFKPATKMDKFKPEISTKPVTISFPTGVSKLDENAKTIIDLQFSEIAKSYANTRIRVEGNTDNVGSKTMNKALSLKRAQSVAKYLQEEYNMNPNRFIIVGNGPDKPVKGCETNATSACKSKNRRTDFKLVAG